MAEYFSIFARMLFNIRFDFASRSNTSTTNHHFFASPTIRLRWQRFVIRLHDESRSGTPLCRYLSRTVSSFIFVPDQHLAVKQCFGGSTFFIVSLLFPSFWKMKQKREKTSKKQISTSNRCSQHPFNGQKIQHATQFIPFS